MRFSRAASSGARFITGLGVACLLAACATDGVSTGVGFAPGATAVLAEAAEGAADASYDDNATYAGHATYRCDDGQTVVVDNEVNVVKLAFQDGSTMHLPASPADSRTRYVEQQYAFVFDGDEALFMKPKAAPVTCKR